MQQLSFLPGAMTPGERSLIQRALKTLDRHLHEPGVAFTSTRAAREWLILNMAGLEREEFRVLYLNNQNQLIAGETLFTGTINRTEVHPREVIKRALYRHEWDMAGIQPSPAQAQNIREKTEAVFRLFRPVHPVVAVSARTGWELDTLVSALMTALPDHAASPLMTRLQDELRTESVRSQAREQFTGAVDRIMVPACEGGKPSTSRVTLY